MQICQTVPRQAVDLHKGSANRRAPEAGLTLVEVLIVLSIIGIATGAAMLRLGIGQQDDRLAASAQTLALEVTLAADAALSSGQDRVLEIGTEEYKLRLDPEPASAPTLWHVLSGIAVTPDAGAGPELRLAADGTAAPFQLRLVQDRRSVLVTFDGLRAQSGSILP